MQPLCGIYKKSVLQIYQNKANAGAYKISEIIAETNYRLIGYQGSSWRNINSADDLKGIDANNV
jgi:molybdopterin-guanine dinucleotide biosynthesis protein A